MSVFNFSWGRPIATVPDIGENPRFHAILRATMTHRSCVSPGPPKCIWLGKNQEQKAAWLFGDRVSDRKTWLVGGPAAWRDGLKSRAALLSLYLPRITIKIFDF